MVERIYRLAQQIVNTAELSKQFYEVELSIMIRSDGGQKTDFIRLQSEKSALISAATASDHIEF
jgi:hypothetical protein